MESKINKRNGVLSVNDLDKIAKIVDSRIVPIVVQNEDLAIMMAKGFHGVDERFDAMDKRFDRLENRMETVENKVDRALYTDNVNLERRVKALESKGTNEIK